MPELTLRTDIGPDVVVTDEQRIGRSETVCPKTGKIVGFVAIYRTKRNLLLHVVDKRRPLGKNREVRFFSLNTRPADILTATADTGAAYSIKEALQRALLIDESVRVMAERVSTEDA